MPYLFVHTYVCLFLCLCVYVRVHVCALPRLHLSNMVKKKRRKTPKILNKQWNKTKTRKPNNIKSKPKKGKEKKLCKALTLNRVCETGSKIRVPHRKLRHLMGHYKCNLCYTPFKITPSIKLTPAFTLPTGAHKKISLQSFKCI